MIAHVAEHFRKAIISIVMVLCVLGAWCALNLPVSIFPQLTVPRIVVSAEAGDIPIPNTLTSVTRPLEAAVSTVAGVVRVASTTSRGASDIQVTLAWGSDMAVALQRMQAQVSEAHSALPPDAHVTVALINPSIFPIMGYSLTSDTLSLAQLRQIGVYTLRPRLARLPGVAQIRITGGDVSEFRVAVDAAALAAHGLTLQDVQDALAHANSVTSVGTFDQSYQRHEILVSGLLSNETDIAAVTVATHSGAPMAVGDIARVYRALQPQTILASGDGHPSVVVNVVKQPDANTVAVADQVRQTLAELSKDLPSGARLSVFYDQSVIVKQSESSVIESIVIGGILALAVLIVFLANARAATIVLLTLPMSLLVSFASMMLLRQTLNIMTLGAMAVALGLVIDDGIVVVETIFHHLENGEPKDEAIRSGLKAITPAMVGSSLTTIVAFLPLIWLTGVTGQFFAPLAIVMMSILINSLLLSLLVIPVLARTLLGNRPVPRATGFVPAMLGRVTGWYGRILALCLRRGWVVVLVLPFIVGVAVWLGGRLQTGFFPEFDEGAFVLDYASPPGTSLAETDRLLRQVEGILRDTPAVASWSRLTGARSGSGLELTEPNQGDILVLLNDRRSAPAADLMDDVRRQIEGTLPQLQVDMAQILQDGIGDIAGDPAPIEVKIFGPDETTLIGLSQQAADIIGKVPGVVEVKSGVVDTGPEMVVQVDSVRASRYGLSTLDVQNEAQAAIRGAVATTVQQGEEGIPVRVLPARPTEYIDPLSLPNVLLAAPALTDVNHRTVPLSEVATLTPRAGTAQIRRENQQFVGSITGRLENRDLGGAVKDVQAAIGDHLKPPPGYRIEYAGLYASQQDSFVQLGRVLMLAVLLVSTLLLVQLRSFRQTFALLSTALMSLSGVVVGLAVTGTPLNISSYTGAIMIVGIITENGIVLFDYLNQLDPALPLLDRLLLAGRTRLRPILMTTLGAILALFPLALGLGAGAAMQKPLAIAVIGGLSMSTFFTLIVAPTLYYLTARPRNLT